MATAQFNMKLINGLKDILFRIHHGESLDSIQKDVERHLQQVSLVEILLIVQQIISVDNEITSEDIMTFLTVYNQLYNCSINDLYDSGFEHQGHPVHVLKAENSKLQSALHSISHMLELLEMGEQQYATNELKKQMSRLGQFYNHYNRKEKLIFPILERYGHYTPGRLMWGEDDQIRNLYKGTKSIIDKLPDIEFKYVRTSYDQFERKFKYMIFKEETLLLPIVLSLFNEDDWHAIAKESDAFGYVMMEAEEDRVSKQNEFVENTNENKKYQTPETDEQPEQIAFGGGYLTTEEANHILNNLPLEITFVDKNGLFKYFNERINESEMMLVRTPTSIGRNVANCHPPNSMKKVMRLIQDLRAKRRTSESMWFRMKGQYIHITYKGIFDENEEFLGVLEYVQDIQPFLELPREVKKELSKLTDI